MSGSTTGGLFFADAGGAMAQDSANLYWDNTTKKLTIGQKSTNFLVDYTNDVSIFKELDDISTDNFGQHLISHVYGVWNPTVYTVGNILAASQSTLQKNGAGRAPYMTANSAVVINNGSGNIDRVIGFSSYITNLGTGTITDVRGFVANSPGSGASNPVATSTGLYISPQKVTGVGTGYGISQLGANDINAFAGKMIFSASSSALNLTGDSSLYVTTSTGIAYPFQETGNLVLQSSGATNSRDIVFATGASPAVRMVVGRAGNVGIGNTNPGELLSLGTAGTTKGVLSLAGNTSGKIIVQPAAAAGTWTMTLPTSAGTSGYFLTTDGNGITSWAPTPGGASYTFSAGLTNTSNTITNNLLTGLAGGQTIIGGTAASESLTLTSTSNATKGFIYLGSAQTSGFDQTNNRFGLLSAVPTHTLTLGSTSNGIALYNTSDQTTNLERLLISSASNVFTINSQNGGTGTLRNIALTVNGAKTFTISNTAAGTGFFNFAGPTSGASANVASTGASTLSSGAYKAFSAVNTINQTSTGGYSMFYASPFEQAVGSGAKYLINVGTNSAASDGGTHTIKFSVDDTGAGYFASNVGIGQTSASTLLYVGSSSVTTGVTVATFQNAGGTCAIVPSTSGGVTCSSDMNLKKNITILADNSTWSYNANIAPANQGALAKILALTPVSYNWNAENDTDPKHAGFIAQEVRQVFPDLVTEDATTHLLSLNYTGFIPYTVQAIKEMNLNIADLSNFERDNSWRDAIISWLGNASNHITRIFTGEICLSEAGQESECLNRAELKALKASLNNQGGNSSAPQTTTVVGPSAPEQTDTGIQSPEVAPVEPVAPTEEVTPPTDPAPAAEAPVSESAE